MIPTVHIVDAVRVAVAAVEFARDTESGSLSLLALRIARDAMDRAIDYVDAGDGHNARRSWLRWGRDQRRQISRAIDALTGGRWIIRRRRGGPVVCYPPAIDWSAIMRRHAEHLDALRHVRTGPGRMVNRRRRDDAGRSAGPTI